MAKYIVVHSVRVCTEFVPETYGRLTAIGPKFRTGVVSRQVCQCKCGKTLTVRVGALCNGNTCSCGCLARETAAKTLTTHGKSRTTEHVAHRHMLARCFNSKTKQFKDYGGRGILVCERWKKFSNFFADMGEKPSPSHTLDRFPDQNGNYEPSNCRWATWEQQANNRTNNHKLAHNGIIMTVAQWAVWTGINYQTIQSRLRLGWDDTRILTTPTRKRIK